MNVETFRPESSGMEQKTHKRKLENDSEPSNESRKRQWPSSDGSVVAIRSPQGAKAYQDVKAQYTKHLTEDVGLQQELRQLEKSFKSLTDHYFPVDKIGEGTFSSVYKAIDLHYHKHENTWDTIYNENKTTSGEQFVALKRIYVTASPRRILNELKLLRKLSGSAYIAPIVTALRYQDQILVVLPYFAHTEFRHYYRYMTMTGIRRYMRDMLSGLEFIHSKRIIHRDIKPANFLFDCSRGYGVIVDFGLAEAETDLTTCSCTTGGLKKRNLHIQSQAGYRKEDRRPGRHANRAGTRGFRAPEVLYRCNSQTTKIDMWSVGVVLLSILTRRVPFFNSIDDEDALIELATIWGKQQVNNCALLHGLVFETSVPTVPDVAYALEDIVGCFSGRSTVNDSGDFEYNEEEESLLEVLKGLLELNFKKRLSATQALNHAFFSVDIDPQQPLVDKLMHRKKDKKQQEHTKEEQSEDGEDGEEDLRDSTEPINGKHGVDEDVDEKVTEEKVMEGDKHENNSILQERENDNQNEIIAEEESEEAKVGVVYQQYEDNYAAAVGF